MKKNASTALRVRWSGSIRGGNSPNYGSRFYFTFNGAPCTWPAGIEAVDWTGANRDYYLHTEFEGLCNNIPAGPIQIGFNVGTLPGITRQPYLGWPTSGNPKITAEEVDLGENKGMCPHHTVFNVKQHTFATADTASGIYSASVFSYTKLAPDTSLRVRWFGALGAKSQSPAPGCLRFYFTFNGEECKAPTPIDGAIAWLTNPIIRTQTTHSIEGICQNLGQGDYAVALNVGQCLFGSLNQMDPDPRVNDVSRIIVEEVRLGKSQFADLPKAAQQVFNLRHWNWYNLNFTGLGEIKSMIYPKMSFDSGLRVSMTATVMTSQYV
ncbi:collagen triple helix repeat-containing protein 1 [Lingula anatina]|uniref:Collagen triple helix repeat-containing protein 1 n=1 Tax=Lingula anatina TaxID=7574 RepID=A0A1S3HSC0_LINAN|nr:collagen triple helix repeat-containing protein 1 [Lingula anatina]|eukprot:XP_013388928.1 collagen triple helix repeat-containing protein 1 [Lingula anatina]